MVVKEAARRFLRISRESTVRKSRKDKCVITEKYMEILQEYVDFKKN